MTMNATDERELGPGASTDELLSVSDAAGMLGVRPETIVFWTDLAVLKPEYTEFSGIRFSASELGKFLPRLSLD